ncbi:MULTISPECIES: FkbM family methyltransferase [unclassified Sulfitobacter]|jgi:FkbM family methyltransferase|uniref:FkbM family methyltransferase n=1 Tax=unclassified Sulfitobacter TaxID=196795 RepID=UPI001594E42E|nr:FkbM family methyltransferase [Sulfitobacter sp. HGT1]MBQ0805097.1 FkbM family methyltransferase [Sulfitobacter sp.]
MTDRYQPKMMPQQPEGLFEKAMHAGQNLPGKPGFICYRKLKRRYRWRNEDIWPKLVADLRAGDLCIDLGANLGEVTTQLANAGAEVIGFEPDPDTFARLVQNVGQMPGVTLYQQAAGAKADTLNLRRSARMAEDPDRFSQSASLVRNDATMDDTNTVPVEVINLPEFLAGLDRDIRILKMDIEGSEWDLMPALMEHPVLDRIDTIFVETHEWMDPARYMPIAHRLQAQAEARDHPYINLFWH